jgi:sulfite exporter TauE/SafE/copper chaperone CopZ
MSHKYLKLPIKGMHCPSCELLVEEKIKEVAQVKSADVNHKTGEAVIYYDGAIPAIGLLNKAITEAGYSVGQSAYLPFLTRDKREYASLGVAFFFLMALFLVLKGLGLTNINLTPSLSNPSWGLIVVIGLVAGFSTCMALVGGLSLGLSTKFLENHPNATSAEKFRPHIYFIIGRILSYGFLGGLLGVLGTVFRFSSAANGILTILVGIVMLVMGLQLINIFPRLSKFKITLPKGIARFFGISQKNKEYSPERAMVLGGLTFFLPCGFTQAMQLYAISTGSFGSGALVMGLFALGTAPGLLSIGGVTSLVKGKFKERFFKVAGLAIIFFALFNLNNGYTLASLNLGSLNRNNSQSEQTVNDLNVVLENGVQVVRMTETNSGYSPNSFSILKDVPVKWIIDAQAPFSCASALIVPQLGIQRNLKAGENIIEFTPTKTGKLPFSCSMGMYTGQFNVYEPNQNGASLGKAAEASPTDTNLSPIANSGSAKPTGACGGSGGGCGGSGGGCGCGGGANIQPDTVKTVAQTDGAVQTISSTYRAGSYLSPNSFKVKSGTKVKFSIDVKDDGIGCGYAIMIPGLYDNAVPLKAGQPIIMEFTPTTPGIYDITCGMEMIRFGSITVE